MKSSSRFLLGFGITIGILVIVAVALVLSTRGNGVSLLPENTPQGTVQRFLVALQDKDFPKAYSYLSVERNGVKMTYDDWLRSKPPIFQSPESAWKATLGNTTITGNSATVEVIVDIFRPSGPFEGPVRSQTIFFQLTKAGDSWFITSPAELYWLYY